MINVAVLTISDRGAAGEREDRSGSTLRDMLDPSLYEIVTYEIIPDDQDMIVERLIDLTSRADLVLTTGGTGLSPRDVTPEATRQVIEREVPGIAEAMRASGLKHTKYSMLSRAVAGIRDRCLIINLPGSPKAVAENLETILDVIPHAVEKILGSEKECAQ